MLRYFYYVVKDMAGVESSIRIIRQLFIQANHKKTKVGVIQERLK